MLIAPRTIFRPTQNRCFQFADAFRVGIVFRIASSTLFRINMCKHIGQGCAPALDIIGLCVVDFADDDQSVKFSKDVDG